ncbi:MAG: hypothetical protein JWM87_3185 [Candidatus Eremiobacteraeota bacterium]|nr:hypothetical protein [Candidatus Eremiobacteraeota bacterium]
MIMPERNVQPVSDAVKEMALQLEREFGIRPLGADEERADDAYAVGHYTGSPKLREC